MQLPRLAIVIVTWNVRDYVLACLDSVYRDISQSSLDATIWLVDNDSTDGTVEAVTARFPATTVIQPGTNLGFAGGNNRALQAIGFPDGNVAELPEYILLLNPDTLVRAGALTALLEGMIATGAGLGGAQLWYGDGTFQHSAFVFPNLFQLAFDLFPLPARFYDSRLNGRYARRHYESKEPFPIDFPLGAVFALRREAIVQTGIFDEQFLLYCEEIDWAIRIKAAGWRVMCIPKSEFVHFGGQSTSQVKPQSVVNLWAARLRLFSKHYGPVTCMLARLMIRVGMKRFIGRASRDLSMDESLRRQLIESYREVIRLTHIHQPISL